MVKNLEPELQASVAKFWEAMGGRFQQRIVTGRAIISQVSRDSAGRVSGALATVDGAGDQKVVIDYGAPVAVGDTYEVANDGGVSAPVWRLVRRIHTQKATPDLDDVPTLPSPTGLTLVKGLYNPDSGQEVQAWIDAHWLTLPHRYGQITYQVACLLTTDPGATPLVLATQDPWPSTYLAREISATETTIPRVVYGGRFSIGRIQILQEKIDFTAATSEEGVGGSPEYPTGIGSANSFYDAAANWTVGQWRNFALRDSNDDLFHITGNSGNTLTVIGTPADGAYFIYPAFCNCSRGVGSTDAVPHDAARGVIGRSWGLLFAGLRAGTDYSVRVRATNAAGATSAWTSWVSIETDPDLTIPPTPTGLTVESADGGVVLEWTGPTLNTTPDLAGFYVFRSADGEDPIKEVGLRNETFVSAELGVEHYYALKSFDTSMNVSPLTSWVLGTAHPATVVNPGALLFTRTGELAEKLNIEAGDPSPHSPPVPGFSPSSTEITLGAAITFTNTSVGATAYLWEFGDGETSADTHPVHTFASAGVFRVRLTCYSDWGEQFIVGKTPITVNASVPEDRVTAGLQYLALFNEGVGRVVYDHSEVGLAYDTTIHGDVTWGSESLTINEDTLISGGVIFSKVIDACMATDEITLEAWVKPVEGGVGCILANSRDERHRGNFILLQDDDLYEVRLRTSGTDPRGFPSLAGEAPATTELQQVTYTRDSSGNAKLYIDAVEIASMTLGGDFSTWDSYRFAMANDVQRARPWLGEIGLVAIYDTALSQADIEQNLMASEGEVGPPPAAPTADFEMSPTSGDAPLWAYITNLSSGNPEEFFWDYDDGIWTNVEEPVVHPYTTPGVFSPSLKVTNAGGSHTKKRTDYITVTDDGEEESGDRYYVSTTGNDRTGDGSKLDPWATIQKGVDEMRRGDTLIVREGTYEERVIFNNVQGASGAWYKIKNASGETPVISGRYSLPSGGSFASTCDGKGFVYGGLVQFNGTNRYIELNGIHIRESRGTGIRGHKDGNGRNLSFINCHIQDTRGATVGIRDYDNVLFEDCVLSGSMNYCQHPRAAREGKKWAGALVINRGLGHIIRGVLLYDCYGEGIHPFSWSGGVVEDCVIFNCMNGMMPITCCQNVTVQRNFVYSTRVFPFLTSSLLNLTMEAGAGADEGGPTQEGRKLKSRDCQVINNIAVDGSFCNRFMDRLSSKEKDYGWGFYKNSLFAHNTLVHHRDSTAEYIIRWLAMYHMGDIATMEFCNNIFWSSGASNKMAKIRAGSPRYRYNCWSQLPTKNKGGDYTNFMGEGDLYESPRLRNANFSLSADGTKGYEWLRRQAEQFQVTDKSPAVGAGRDAGVLKDFWGNNRGSSPSMGAHEP